MKPLTGKKFEWRSSDNDPRYPNDNHEICNNKGAYCYYYPTQKKLIMSEEGKYYDDHAVAVFKVRGKKHAETIIKALTDLKTC